MTKIKYALVTLGFLTYSGGSCADTIQNGYNGQRGGISEEALVYAPGAAFGDNETICRDLGKLLTDEFDDFKCFEVCGKEDENKECKRWDLIIRGYNERDDVYWPVWGVNIPDVCSAYNQGRWLWEVFVGRDIYIEQSNGSVVSYRSMNRNVAKKLGAFMGIRAQFNEDCERSAWREIQKKHGLTNQPGKQFNSVR